jgi:hypothetical protein
VQYPSPSDFVIRYTNGGQTTDPASARDYVSDSAPILSVNMSDTFANTSSLTFPYEWERGATVVSPAVNTTTSTLTVQFAGNPVLPSGLFNGLFLVYNDGFTVQTTQVIGFSNLNNNSYLVQLASSIDFVATSPNLLFRTSTLTNTSLYIPRSSSSSVNVLNYYIGFYVYDYVNQSSSRIIAYDNISRLLTLESSVSAIPERFVILPSRNILQTTVSSIDAGNFTLTVPSNYPYADQYIYNLTNGYTARVQSVSGAFNIRLNQPVDMAQFNVGNPILLLSFSRDNEVTLKNVAKHSAAQNAVCHDVQLVSMHIPNIPLARHPGGFLVDYPYLLVELVNTSGASSAGDVFYTNDPQLRKSLFVCPVQDIASPEFSAFVKLSGNGINQTIKFKVTDTLRFTVRTPDGQPIQFIEQDALSPFPPNARLQLSAVFSATPTP